MPDAAAIGEVESADDETWEKLPFYASRGVDEVADVSGERRSVTWLVREGDGYAAMLSSRILAPAAESLDARIDWPDSTAADR